MLPGKIIYRTGPKLENSFGWQLKGNLAQNISGYSGIYIFSANLEKDLFSAKSIVCMYSKRYAD